MSLFGQFLYAFYNFTFFFFSVKLYIKTIYKLFFQLNKETEKTKNKNYKIELRTLLIITKSVYYGLGSF